MAGKNKNSSIKEKAKQRNKAISSNVVKQEALSEASSASFTASVAATEPIYIHNSMEYFLAAAPKVNQKLAEQISTLQSAWASEVAFLIGKCQDKENDFFSKIADKLNGPELPKDPKLAFEALLQQTMTNYEFNPYFAEVIELYKKLPKGTKTVKQLEQIVEFVNRLKQKIKDAQDASMQFDDNFLKRLTELQEECDKFTQWCKSVNIQGSERTRWKRKPLQHTSGISTRKLMLDIMPNLLEGLLLNAMIDTGKDILIDGLPIEVKSVASNTATGTTVDNMFGDIGFSIKTNTKQIKQTKTRYMDTFFQWNEKIKEQKELNSVQNLMTELNSDNYSIQSMLQYIILNYGSFVNLSDKKILEDAFRVIILTNLNQKMFGYNKLGQADIEIADLIQDFPVAGINSEGKVVWYADLFTKLLEQLNTYPNKIKSLATCKITPGSYNRDWLYKKKQEAIGNKKDVSYVWLKEQIAGYLENAQKQLAASVHLTVQYHLDIEKIFSKEQK